MGEMGCGVGQKVQVPWGGHGYLQGLQDREHMKTTVPRVRELLSLQELLVSVPQSEHLHLSWPLEFQELMDQRRRRRWQCELRGDAQ